MVPARILAATRLLVACALPLALLAGDFSPPRPYVYVTPADVARMRDNVAKHAWAQSLYSEAKAVSDANASGQLILGQGNTVGLKTGKFLMAHGLCHLISGEQKYADRAISWLRIYAQNNINYDSFSDDVPGAADRLGSWYAIFPVVYDMVFDRMAAADRTLITNWLANRWYSAKHMKNFEGNQIFGQAASVLVTAFALGDLAKMDASTQAFRSHQSGWAGSYFWDPSTQAWKNWYFTCDSAMLVGIVSHNAKRAGYAGIDLLLDPIADGWNLKDGNFKTIYDYCTPLGQVPYQSMWRGGMFLNQTGTYATQALDILAQREDWPDKETYAWFVHKNPGKKMYAHDWEMFDLWPGLTWGRHIAATPQPRNDSVNHPGRGFAVLKSGHPAGPMTDDTLHAYLMHGIYGTVEGMNLKLYGKGRKLTQERMLQPDNAWGELGGGGIYMHEPKAPAPADLYAVGKAYQAGARQLLWSVDSEHLKIMVFDFRGENATPLGTHVRTVAATNEYFWDVYRCNGGGPRKYQYWCDGVGNTATASIALGKATSADYWVEWAKHMRYWAVNDAPTAISFSPYSDLAVKVSQQSAAGTRDQYESENINQLRILRSNASGPQDFIGVYEPLGGGTTRLTSVGRFNTTGTAEATAIRVVGLDYTDILAYQHTVADRTLASGTESVRCTGRHGYIRYHTATRALIVQGDIAAFTVRAPQAASLVVNGTPRTFTQSGELVSWSGSGSPPADTIAPTAPGSLTATVGGTAAVALAWTAATDNVGVTGYVVSRDGTAIATVTGTTYTASGLDAATTYAFAVRARDAAGNLSPAATASATTPPQTTTPSAFARIEAESYAAQNGLGTFDGGSGRKIGSIENGTWASYRLDFGAGAAGCQFRAASNTSGGTIELRLGSTTGTLLGVCAVPGTGGWNNFVDLACPISGASGVQPLYLVFRGGGGSLLDVDWFQFTAPPAVDAQAPTQPANLVAAATGSTTATLTWTASTDNVLVTGYEVRRDGVAIGTVATATFADTGLAPATAYSYTVRARDAAGNWSAASAAAAITTPALPATGSAYTTIQAEEFDAMQGVSVNDADVGRKVGNIQQGDWVRFDDVDFGAGAASVSIRVASATSGGNIQVRLDGPTGTRIATVWVPVTGGWNTFTIRSADLNRSVTGVQDICLLFTGSGAGSLYDVDWFRFTPATTTAALPLAPYRLAATATADGATQVSGKADPGAVVTVLVDGIAQGTAIAAADGSWAWLAQTLAGEPQVVTAVATDASGGTSATSAAILVPGEPAAPGGTAALGTSGNATGGSCGMGGGMAGLILALACLPLRRSRRGRCDPSRSA